MASWTRRELLKSATLTSAAALASHWSLAADPTPSAARPNIIFILTDDQRWDSLGCMGNLVLKTPNIDALAQSGVRFTHAYVTTSICCCSRASILTGQYTCRHHIPDFATPLSADALDQTYPAVLRRNGYYTGFIGKYGVGSKLPANAFDFTRAIPQFNAYWQKDKSGRRVHTIDQDTQYALEFLQSCPADRPFCLSLSYRAPHAQDGHPDQYLYMPEDESLYQDVDVPTPRTASDRHFNSLPPFLANEKNEGRVRWRKRFDTPQKYQKYVKAYYRLITEIDRSIGRVVAELRRQGKDGNTIIIFTGDNGYFLGEHGLADKWYPYEESVRIPLVVYDPRLPFNQRNRTIDDCVLNIDFAPTILSMAGCPVPARMQGRDFSPLYSGNRPANWRTDFYYEHHFKHPGIPPSEALITPQMKYILWPQQSCEELFDLRTDPGEEHNLISDPKYQDTLRTLRQRFAQLRTKAKEGQPA